LITLFIRGLSRATTDESLNSLFSQYGVVRSQKLQKDMFTGDCRGFASIEMEGHEARAAISALDGKEINGSVLRVGPERKSGGNKGRRRR
jgi:RNA recognition motif-containing protein